MIEVKRTLDIGLILDVLTNESILDSITEDNEGINSIDIDVINDYWLSICSDKAVIGVIQFKQMFSNCFDAHIHILPEHRKEHSLNAGKKIIDWCYENIKGSLLLTYVPEFCVNVINFLNCFDFKMVGALDSAITKNGSKHDLIMLSKRVV